MLPTFAGLDSGAVLKPLAPVRLRPAGASLAETYSDVQLWKRRSAASSSHDSPCSVFPAGRAFSSKKPRLAPTLTF
jgi:hypothetical protein